MAAQFDRRNNPVTDELIKKLPRVKHRPLVSVSDLEEVEKVFRALPELDFPINSAGELIDKLGKKDIKIAGVPVDPLRMIKYMPAYYFPIASVENLTEKMAELIRSNRKQVDLPRELAAIRRQLPPLKFPVDDADGFLKMIGTRSRYQFRGREVMAEEMVKRLPKGFFPVRSQEDLERKIAYVMANRPLIVKD